jgi:dihydropteroate synthase-like protein
MIQPFKPESNHHNYFVTGRLAEASVRQIVASLAERYGFDYTIGVMPITVAALMTQRWLRRHLDVPAEATHVILPGYCDSGPEHWSEFVKIPVIYGPKDCRQLPELFGDGRTEPDLSEHRIEILAEINHVPRRSISDVVQTAKRFIADGADCIDLGCDPAAPCRHIGDYVAALFDAGIDHLSIDTFDPQEAQAAIQRGARLVLSVNSSNRQHAVDWGCEVVVIPDYPGDKKSFHETVNFLTLHRVPMRLDPILEPIGAGLMNSLIRYAETREQFPNHAMMMGIGNLTELSDVDSAGINFLLLGICAELNIQSVLTTQVINWARTSVRECDLARRLVHYSVTRGVPPKRLSDQLVMLRDPKLLPFPPEALTALAETLKDNNYRLFAQDDEIHLLAAKLHLHDDDPFRLFERLLAEPCSENVDPGHAFYLGFEMAKASIALLLGKQYEQDEALRWGQLTKQEDHHRLQRSHKFRRHAAE